MTIKRKIGDVWIVFKLTAEEIEKAYQIRKKQCLQIDIEDFLADLGECGNLSGKDYGTVVCDVDFIERVVSKFGANEDTTVSYTDTLRVSVKEALKERGIDLTV